MTNICLNCKYFISYMKYYEDDLEPDWCGFCEHNYSDKHVDGEDLACRHFDIKGWVVYET